MGTNPNSPPNDPPCSTIAYRLALKAGWIDPDDPTKAQAEAFARRRPKTRPDGGVDPGDDDGLSVFDSFFWPDLKACIETNSNRCYGIISVHVGTLLDHGLHVIRDPKDRTRLLITDLPLESPNNAEAEDLLEEIATTARIKVRCNYRRKH